MADDAVDGLIDAGTALLGIGIEPEWRDAIRLNLTTALRFAESVESFPLPDEAEPAPVFRA